MPLGERSRPTFGATASYKGNRLGMPIAHTDKCAFPKVCIIQQSYIKGLVGVA
jgi:hypothetical protein